MLELVVAREFVEFLMKKHEVVLNDQHSIWFNTEVGDPKVQFRGPLHFVIYIDNLSDNLLSNPVNCFLTTHLLF